MELNLRNKMNDNFAPIVYGVYYETFVSEWYRYLMIVIYPIGAVVGVLMAYGSVAGF